MSDPITTLARASRPVLVIKHDAAPKTGGWLVDWWDERNAQIRGEKFVAAFVAEQTRLRTPPVDGAQSLFRVLEHMKQGA